MSRDFDFSRLLAGYSGGAAISKRVSPGVVIAAVDVFAVVVGLAAMHVSGLMWTGTQPPHAAAPSLISPVNADDRVAAAWPNPRLRPIVASVHLAAAPEAALVFATPVVTDVSYAGASTFAPASSSSPPQQVASVPAAPIVAVDPAPSPAAPPVAKLVDIAIAGHVAQRPVDVALSADTTLDDLLLSRGSSNATAAVNVGTIGNGSPTLAVNADVGASRPASVNVSANVEVASAAPVVQAVAAPVTSAVNHTVGGVVGAVRGLLN